VISLYRGRVKLVGDVTTITFLIELLVPAYFPLISLVIASWQLMQHPVSHLWHSILIAAISWCFFCHIHLSHSFFFIMTIGLVSIGLALSSVHVHSFFGTLYFYCYLLMSNTTWNFFFSSAKGSTVPIHLQSTPIDHPSDFCAS
jgi:hypothetical protein